MLTDQDWTPEMVAERLVDAFRHLPDTPIYSPTRNSFVNLTGARVAGMTLLVEPPTFWGTIPTAG